MEQFSLLGLKPAQFYVEESALNGVKRVAGKVLNDFNRISGRNDALLTLSKAADICDYAVLFATCDESAFVSEAEKRGLISLEGIRGAWETYGYFILDDVDKIAKKLLVVVGSDKLGTIYGMFGLSEKMGVSPLVYWADSCVVSKSEIKIEIENGFVSKEPSVKFRGFFINDEWPCYGNWTMDHFGGFNAEMYDHVFELLLRLKGNYLWPAMWSSSFALDGPGLASYELADEYGIYIGNSHHEPCLRAGEEYSKVRGKGSIYGDAWNFHTNTEGITRFWRDSLMERGGFTSMITVGMRGEADSKILGENATLKDNIDLLKKVIVCQQQLIKEAEEKFNKKYPKMLALYKEVEPFYYGDENTEGLCDWDELSDVTMMLCEDNYGYLRTVPDEKMRKHPAGFGMYYHVDYHGSPISYEWINSTPLTKMWEQMTQAYEYGIRNVWILNVGDLKHNEFPLSFFLNLAYDFDKWGTSAPNTTFEYTKEALRLHFGSNFSEKKLIEACEILTETVRINALRRPEALNSSIYHPCHYFEADRMLKRVSDLEKREEAFSNSLSNEEAEAWYSLSGFQTKATVNLVRMHLYAGKNNLYAYQGRKTANCYADLTKQALEKDEELKGVFAKFKDGKWSGMELASHIGFIKWNEDGARKPIRMYIEPFDRPRLFALRADEERVYDKVYGPPMEIEVNDFCFEGEENVPLVLANTGVGTLKYKIEMPECGWLSTDSLGGEFEDEKVVLLSCDRSKLPVEKETVKIKIVGGDTTVFVKVSGKKLSNDIIGSLPKMTFLTGRDGFIINAEHYAKAATGVKVLEDYGIWEEGVKFFPVYSPEKRKDEPFLSYNVYSEEGGELEAELVFAPTNPLSRECILRAGISVNGEKGKYQNTVPANYKSGEASDRVWGEGALNHRHTVCFTIGLKKGLNEVKILMPDAGLVALRMNIYKEKPAVSYLGGNESVYTK